MRRHHPTAADRAQHARKRSTSPAHAHSHQRLKQQRTQLNSSTVNDENINTINTHTASLSEPHSPSPSSPIAVDCCECTHCPAAPSPASINGEAHHALHCCWDIEPAAHLSGDSAPLCQRSDITSTVRDGISTADFDYHGKRIRVGRPASFAACNPAQRRLMLYAVLHAMLYGQGSRGQRDPLPECIKHMVRTQHADSGTVAI